MLNGETTGKSDRSLKAGLVEIVIYAAFQKGRKAVEALNRLPQHWSTVASSRYGTRSGSANPSYPGSKDFFNAN